MMSQLHKFIFNFYHPPKKLRKVMFSEVSHSVLLFIGRGGLPTYLRPYLPPNGSTAGGMHPTGMHFCYRPQTKFAKVIFLHVSFCPRGGGSPGPHLEGEGGRLRGLAGGSLHVHTHGGGGCIPTCTEADTPQQMATAAGGTHPTGMHSCFLLIQRSFAFLAGISLQT